MTEIAATKYARALMRALIGAAVVVVMVEAAAPAVADPVPPAPGDCGGHYTFEIPTDHAVPPLGIPVPPDQNLRAPAPAPRACADGR